VAVITLRGETGDQNVNRVVQQLREARTDPNVEAVVLRVDSPGGPVDSSEEFYLAVNRTANEIPVVAYVEGLAASGGYYGILPAETIVVKPSSTVGSVGVIVQAPLSAVEQAQREREGFVRSGPDKAQITVDGLRSEIETLQQAFVGSVLFHRGDDITLSDSEVANADVYLGAAAVENGFADRIGDIGTAIERAAELADGIEGDRYEVDYRSSVPTGPGLFSEAERIERADGVVYVVSEDRDNGPEFVQPVRYYAIWGIPVDDSETPPTANATRGGEGR
jgi:protease-4